MKRTFVASIAVLCVVVASGSALAQYDGGASVWIGLGPPAVLGDLNNRMLMGTTSAARGALSPNAAALQRSTVPTQLQRYEQTGADQVIRQLAATYPPEHRQQAASAFRELRTGFQKIERQFDLPRGDVAGAVAAFLAGSYMAYRNVDFPDANFKPLVAQMRQIVGSNPAFAEATAAQRQDAFDQLSMLGMLMATTQMALAQQANPRVEAALRSTAKGYLEQFLKTDADRVQITAQGLVLR